MVIFEKIQFLISYFLIQKYEDEEKKVVRNNEELKADLMKLEEYFDLFSKEIKEKEKKYKVILDE